jgi:hypothetical protein
MDTLSIADTMEAELSRIRAARPALDSRISRAEHILVTQLSVSNGTRPIKVRVAADGSRSYTVRSGSRLSRSYAVDPESFSCDCPDARRRGKGCKHAIVCYVFDRAVFATRPAVASEKGERCHRAPAHHRDSFAGTRRDPATVATGLARMAG